MSNSLEQILERMSQGSVTLGWGAVAAYSRERLNRLLEQQYLTRLRENTYLPPFSGMLSGDNVGDIVKLQGLEFGTPLLSFSNASVSDSKARVRLNIVKGTVERLGSLISSFEITEAAGYWLEMEVDLATVQGEVDPYGRVVLNLARGARFSTNLLEVDTGLNQKLVAALEDWMKYRPAQCAMFELGTVDYFGYDPLTPTRFILRTQAAPGARVRGASNYGDGAVLVFIRLRDNPVDGQVPDESYLYLLPDGDYSATLVLSQDMLGYASEEGLEVLARLLFPELNAFVSKVDLEPFDRAIFGNIDPLRTHLTVEPALGTVLAAGEQQQFVLKDGNGQLIEASRWAAFNPQSHTGYASGTIDNQGLYTAPGEDENGQEILNIIITAEYDEQDELGKVITYRAAARLLVTSENVLVMPGANALGTKHFAEGFGVWNAGKDLVAWDLLEPRFGELANVGARQARFVPQRHASRRILSVQQLQATASEQRNAALLMANSQLLVTLDPPLVPTLLYGASQQLHDINRIMPNAPRRWRVMAGAGKVTSSGHFTASTQYKAHSNIVACEVVQNGVVFAAGYSVVRETAVQASSTWKELELFSITVGKNADGIIGNLHPSGYQQLDIEITVRTRQVDGKDYKLSPAEMATMALFDRSGQMIAGLCDNEEGIGSVYGAVWRTSLVRNRFELGYRGPIAMDESDPAYDQETQRPELPRSDEDRTTRQDIYLLRRGNSSSQVFHAGFQSESGEWHFSTAIAHRNSTIEVQVRPQKLFGRGDYHFERKRSGGTGGDLGGANPEHEDFDLHPVTEDCWLLSYPGGSFYTAEFITAKETDAASELNLSMVRWESVFAGERYHSYTGYCFQGHNKPEPVHVSYDRDMAQVLGRTDFVKLPGRYEEAFLAIYNFRDKNRTLRDVRDLPAFARMSKPLYVRLRDSVGNRHLIKIDYLPAGIIGDRNVLDYSVPSRPQAQQVTTLRLSE